jgi:hypothetical protein
VTRHVAIATALSAASVAAALASGSHRRAALVGALSASLTALASMLAMGRLSRSASKPVQAALAVMAIAFLVRIVLVALGTALVVRSGENVVAFVVAFFVPYFAFAAVEGAYVHSLRGGTGPLA